jgi:hypothetical protein
VVAAKEHNNCSRPSHRKAEIIPTFKGAFHRMHLPAYLKLLQVIQRFLKIMFHFQHKNHIVDGKLSQGEYAKGDCT